VNSKEIPLQQNPMALIPTKDSKGLEEQVKREISQEKGDD
jgi:hypothetical protein